MTLRMENLLSVVSSGRNLDYCGMQGASLLRDVIVVHVKNPVKVVISLEEAMTFRRIVFRLLH